MSDIMPPPAASQPEERPVVVAREPRGREGWRMLAAAIIGFILPVLACYGLVMVTALACQVATFTTPAVPFSPVRGDTGSGPAVAVIRVEGVITSIGADPFTDGIASAETITEQVEQAQANDDVKAILLYVDSPGGGVNASDVIYHALQQVDKPIVVLMGDTAASGGYYISMASDWIIAHPNTLTGSIGVVSEFVSAEELLDKVGVEFVVITSGPRKDFGSPYREMTEAEREYWQSIVDEIYADFVAIVAEGRGMTVDQVLPLADGRVYTGRQALDHGLVDALGYEEDAVAKAAELGGIEGEPRIIEYETEPAFLDLLTQISLSRPAIPSVAEILTLIGHPRLGFRWTGP